MWQNKSAVPRRIRRFQSLSAVMQFAVNTAEQGGNKHSGTKGIKPRHISGYRQDTVETVANAETKTGTHCNGEPVMLGIKEIPAHISQNRQSENC